MDQSTGDLSERLSRLESQQAKLHRSNKHLRMMIGAMVLICGALFTMAETSSVVPDTLEAQQFLLRDSTGKLRGSMGVLSDGAVGFNLEDTSGRTRLAVDLASNGTPGMDFFDSNGKMRATIAIGPTGEPGVGLYGPDGHLRTALDTPKKDTPGLSFYPDNGKPAWGAP